jgi:hypothetical protein
MEQADSVPVSWPMQQHDKDHCGEACGDDPGNLPTGDDGVQQVDCVRMYDRSE